MLTSVQKNLVGALFELPPLEFALGLLASAELQAKLDEVRMLLVVVAEQFLLRVVFAFAKIDRTVVLLGRLACLSLPLALHSTFGTHLQQSGIRLLVDHTVRLLPPSRRVDCRLELLVLADVQRFLGLLRVVQRLAEEPEDILGRLVLQEGLVAVEHSHVHVGHLELDALDLALLGHLQLFERLSELLVELDFSLLHVGALRIVSLLVAVGVGRVALVGCSTTSSSSSSTTATTIA